VTNNTASSPIGTKEQKENTMPHVIVKALPGKSEQQRFDSRKEITQRRDDVLSYEKSQCR